MGTHGIATLARFEIPTELNIFSSRERVPLPSLPSTPSTASAMLSSWAVSRFRYTMGLHLTVIALIFQWSQIQDGHENTARFSFLLNQACRAALTCSPFVPVGGQEYFDSFYFTCPNASPPVYGLNTLGTRAGSTYLKRFSMAVMMFTSLCRLGPRRPLLYIR